ncbi:MAG: preprotein translocase subunit SecD, partial [Pseudonocardiales bacterium]|nr:preprotein translocase subunit SecD [Pseudonocardiales bacterium]
GVTEATVVVQGSNQLVVSIPGSTNTDISKLGAAAQLTMRGLVMPVVPLTPVAPTTSSSSQPSTGTSSSPTSAAPPTAAASSGSTSAHALAPRAAATTTPAPSTPASSAPAAPTASATASASARVKDPLAGLGFAVPTSDTAFAALQPAQQQALQAALTRTDCSLTNTQSDKAPYYVACDNSNNSKATGAFLLGSVIVPGTEIKSAGAQSPNVTQGQTEWTVALTFKSAGDAAWAHYTGAHNVSKLGQVTPNPSSCSLTSVPCADFVAFTLDGQVLSAPYNQSAINGGTTQISGSFTQSSANQLANQLKYGALPLSFTPQNRQTVSPTLGSAQLKAGLLAGGIGLVLVVIYSLIYYRALGLVTIASLIVSGILTYGFLVMLGTQIGFTLSLAGIAGFIVAVGITADSFVVFFERLKDEVHDGRSIRVAVPRAWVRARRTILSADTVSFLAAAILYYFAAGDVKGFAFTLGLSTILDLVVVFLFTHPLVSLLSRSATFGSARFTGLDALRGTPLPESASDAEGRRGRPRLRSPRRSTTSASAAERAAERHGTSVALAERDSEDADRAEDLDDLDEDDVETEDVDEVEEPEEVEPDAVEAEPVDAIAEDSPQPEPEPAPRQRRTPSAGTAAERAAARRARLRSQKDEGQS